MNMDHILDKPYVIKLLNFFSRLEIVTELAASKPMAVSYLHSFFMTENYVIFTEQPWILGDFGKMIYEHVLKGKLHQNYSIFFLKPYLFNF